MGFTHTHVTTLQRRAEQISPTSPALPRSLRCPQLRGVGRRSRLPQPEAEGVLGGDQLQRKAGKRAGLGLFCLSSLTPCLHETFGPLPPPIWSQFSTDKCPRSAGIQSPGREPERPRGRADSFWLLQRGWLAAPQHTSAWHRVRSEPSPRPKQSQAMALPACVTCSVAAAHVLAGPGQRCPPSMVWHHPCGSVCPRPVALQPVPFHSPAQGT